MRLDSGTGQRRARVEMIPLIDCMFILLVFFIYSMLSMTIQRGVPVNLPAGTRVDRISEEAVVITIAPSGDLFLNRMPVPLDDLAASIGELTGDDPAPRIVLNADAEARHRAVFAVLDVLRSRGWTNVSILSTEAPQR